MAKEKKELTAADIDKFVAAYAKKNEISEAEAKRRIMATGVSRLKALATHAANQGGGGGRKKATKKAAKKPAKKAAKKKAPRKPKAKPTPAKAVSEGEEG
jgi:hypothetical protein